MRGTLGPHLQEETFKLTPGTSIQGINSGPQFQVMNSLELNPESKPQTVNKVQEAQIRATGLKHRVFELTRGSAAHCTKSAVLNAGTPFQGIKSFNLVIEAKFKENSFFMNPLGSWQQAAQPI